jgi:hypothetical protein
MKDPDHHQLFCKTCGVHTFHKLSKPALGGDIVSVNVACLDDVEPEDFAAFKIKYSDGKNDSWWNEPKEKQLL